MQVKIVRKTEQKTTKWSGGTTTQLAIFPETATYEQRNFIYRISTAKIEAATSVFTSLPGISRCLMVLEGNLTINHAGHYSKTLQKFDTDSFDGGWKTTSSGKVTDFNLMTSNQATGIVLSKTLFPQQTCTEIDCNNYDVVAIYFLSGTAEIGCNNKKYIVGENDFLMVFFGPESGIIKFTAHEYCEIAVTTIQLNQL